MVRFIKKMVVSLSAVFLLLASLEIAFRIYDYGFKYRELEYRYSKGEVNLPFDTLFAYFFKKGYIVRDQKLIWRRSAKKKGQYRFGSLGFRIGDKGEPLRSKGDNTYRIIVFGGSQPFGIGLDYEDTYACKLEALFNKDPSTWKRPVEVINAAVPGHSTTQALNFLKYDMICYEPDLVIIDAGNNDGIQLSPEWPWSDNELIERMGHFQYRLLGMIERSSFFWYYRNLLYKLRGIFLTDKSHPKKTCPTRVTTEQNFNNLKEIKRIAQDNGFKAVFISQVYFDNDTGKLKRGFGSFEEPYIDIYSRLKEKDGLGDYFIDSVHSSRLGHKEIARLIYEYVKPLVLGDLRQ